MDLTARYFAESMTAIEQGYCHLYPHFATMIAYQYSAIRRVDSERDSELSEYLRSKNENGKSMRSTRVAKPLFSKNYH
ncbi:MAG: hypothetical protein OSB19_04280 [Opitutaceae bacterium]|nr:hypothetical protein [Opitutaceae bacterium]